MGTRSASQDGGPHVRECHTREAGRRPEQGLGLAAAGLAIVVAIGIGFTLSEDNAASPSDVRPAQPQVSDSRRMKAEMSAQRDTVSPGADVEANEASHYDREERRVRMAKTPGHKTGKGEVAGG